MVFLIEDSDVEESSLQADQDGKIKLKRRKISGRKKFCPSCLSELEAKSPFSGWLVPDYYYCLKCGYSGYVALEETPKED